MYSVIHLTSEQHNRYGCMTPLLQSINKPQLSFEQEQELLQKYERENTRVYAAIEDNRLIGIATVEVFKNGNHMQASIDDVAVHQSSQGRGVGKAIIQQTLNFAKSQNCDIISIFPLNDELIPFYQKLGFVVKGNRFMQLKK